MRVLTTLTLSVMIVGSVVGRPANYDENKIAPYTLPDPLRFVDGKRLNERSQWPQRRAEIMRIFADQMYGVMPPPPQVMRLELLEEKSIMQGRGVRKQIRMWFKSDNSGPKIDWILFMPVSDKPVPAYIGLNYYGNQEIDPDPTIRLNQSWLRNNKIHFIADHRASEKSRGLFPKAWPYELLINRGYALATACYGDVASDEPTLYTNDVHQVFADFKADAGDNTTALSAWAWALMRGLDMLEKEVRVDAKQVAVVGCSRLAKAALLAGASDERFAVVIPNQTGGGGVPLAKRDYGENVALQNQKFPHWFCNNFRQYSDNEAAMPFDQHLLLAACAPRHLFVSSFPGKWFDPFGEFLSMKAAESAWHFLGCGTLPATEWPAEMEVVMGSHLAYYRRPFEHGIATLDWECYLKFTDQIFGEQVEWQAQKSDKWSGFTRHYLAVDECAATVIVPSNPKAGNPWLWHLVASSASELDGAAAEIVKSGFHYVTVSLKPQWDDATVQRHLESLSAYFTAKGLRSKGALFAIGDPAAHAANYAERVPGRVTTVLKGDEASVLQSLKASTDSEDLLRCKYVREPLKFY